MGGLSLLKLVEYLRLPEAKVSEFASRSKIDFCEGDGEEVKEVLPLLLVLRVGVDADDGVAEVGGFLLSMVTP